MDHVERARTETVAHYRTLDEHAAFRQHFRHADEDGNLWYFEAVPDRGELVVVRQAELTPSGRLLRYDWRHLEDEHGFLTDQPIDLAEGPVEVIAAEEFRRVWAG
ncbi:hypothetical protein [Streptomyces sp. BRB081]|uniref:hypothetical protein n=1 Tax=Streptomyces sp. BRB081 TaxID=2769544 RepID=UPI0018ACA476|nr:hypothetical protein [Streptomyces sp. BRB081]MBL3804906.1 hypothetical protein [Streptomyces sp. BRB081]